MLGLLQSELFVSNKNLGLLQYVKDNGDLRDTCKLI